MDKMLFYFILLFKCVMAIQLIDSTFKAGADEL